MQWFSTARTLSADRLGWSCDLKAIVLGPGRTLGARNVAFRSEMVSGAAAELRGTGPLAVVRTSDSSLRTDNPILLLSVSIALAGPLPALFGHEGGGFHLRGESSRGKTTARKAAVSIRDPPRLPQSPRGRLRSGEDRAGLR